MVLNIYYDYVIQFFCYVSSLHREKFTGVGNEFVFRRLRLRSKLSELKFIEVNCQRWWDLLLLN